MAKPLSERIESALSTDRVTLNDLERLVDEAAAERDALSAAAIQANADAFNFLLAVEARDDAARRADSLGRSATAIAAALEQLAAKLEIKRNSAAHKAKQAERAAIIAERDALADELVSEWPELERRLIGLLGRIKDSDARMRAAGTPTSVRRA